MGKENLIGDTSLSLQIKPWKSLDGAFVVLMYIDSGEVVRTTRLRPTLSVLKMVGGKLTLIGTAEIDDPRCRELPQDTAALEPNESGDACLEMKRDLAAYRISPAETALGLRTKIREVFPARESETEYLTLFQIVDQTLKPIFTYRMSLDDEQRGPGDLTTIDSVLRVSDHRTLGYFDLLAVENVRSEKIGSDVAKTKRIVHRFLWQDGGYAAAK